MICLFKSVDNVEPKHVSERVYEHHQETSSQTKGKLPSLQLAGLQKGTAETASSSGRSSEGNVAGDTVDMNIDVQVSVKLFVTFFIKLRDCWSFLIQEKMAFWNVVSSSACLLSAGKYLIR